MRLKILILILFLAGFRIFEIIPQIHDGDESGKEEHEDRDRVKKVYWESMNAADYANALEISGMKKAKEIEKISSTSWLSIGPVGAISPNGYNGRISGIYVRAINNGYYVYAGACSGGLWRARSYDGIGVWNSLGDGLPNPSVRAFAVHPDNPDDIFVGTGDYSRYKGSGMFHTVNAGMNWSKITLPNDPNEFYRIEYLPGNNKILNAACTDGILRSTDGGNTWKNVLAGQATDLIINPSIPNIQYTCIVNKGVFRTLNGGETWQLVNSVTSPFGRASIALCNADPSTLVILVEDGSANLQGVFISNNGGANWDNITNNINGLSGSSGQVDHAQAVFINPYDPNDIWVASVSAFESIDGGKNWASKDLGHADFAALYNNPASGNILWAGNDGGIFAYESGNVQNWNGNSATGLRCSEIDFMDSKRGFRTIGLQDNGIIRSTDYGGNWSIIHTGDGFGTTITDDLNFTFWFTDGQYPAPARRVWKKTLDGDPEYQPNNDANLYVHWFDRNSKKIFLAAGTTLISKNANAPAGDWTTEGPLPISDVHLLSGSSLDGQTIYITNETAPKIIAARWNGTSWNFSNYDFKGTGSTRAVYVSTENPGEAWVGLRRTKNNEPNIYHTIDYGSSWTDISTKALRAAQNIEAIVAKPLNHNEIYAGTDIGIFVSYDGGKLWQPLQDGLPVVRCSGLRYVLNPDHSGNDYLLLSTYGRGMYERIITTNPISYVDENAAGFSDGTFDYPYQLFLFGYNNTSPNGILALRSKTYMLGTGNNGPLILKDPKVITSYGGTSIINLSSSGTQHRELSQKLNK